MHPSRPIRYVTSWPFESLEAGRTAAAATDPASQRLLFVAGVNHVEAGTASYSNVALSDPLQKLGLSSFDDEEMRVRVMRTIMSTCLLAVVSVFMAATLTESTFQLPLTYGLT